jgi:hypothetical protein
MTSAQDWEAIFQAAIAGIPAVASAIAAIPKEHRERGFRAAERSYQETTRDLNCPEDIGTSWVSAMMYSVRAEVEKMDGAASGN